MACGWEVRSRTRGSRALSGTPLGCSGLQRPLVAHAPWEDSRHLSQDLSLSVQSAPLPASSVLSSPACGFRQKAGLKAALARSYSASELPSRPAVMARSHCSEREPREGRASPGSFGKSCGQGFSVNLPMKVMALPDPSIHGANMAKVGPPKVPALNPDSSAAFRRVSGCPLSHGSHSDLSKQTVSSAEEVVGALTPLQGGVSKPPTKRQTRH
mmetsp:Transcript_12033/g.32995  ORF Transcript_12033/g.32995 Transcript_12033/m.32995 type:complete len:213 (-) Transcript_12033:242-880(-)